MIKFQTFCLLRDNTSRRRDVKSADVITFMPWQSVWFWRSCSSYIRVGLCYLWESFLSYSRLVVHVNYVTFFSSENVHWYFKMMHTKFDGHRTLGCGLDMDIYTHATNSNTTILCYGYYVV